MQFESAKDVIQENQMAVAVFTRGVHFHVDALGNGFTAKWVVDPEWLEEVDKVIVYLRRDDEDVNRVFLGNYAGSRRSDEPNRSEIRFSGLKEVGTTEKNWPEFSGGGQNPVCYVSR